MKKGLGKTYQNIVKLIDFEEKIIGKNSKDCEVFIVLELCEGKKHIVEIFEISIISYKFLSFLTKSYRKPLQLNRREEHQEGNRH